MTKTKTQVPKYGTIALSLRVPPDLDQVVDQLVLIERRKKRAILELALEEYCQRHHPGLLDRETGPCNSAAGPWRPD